MTNRNSSNLARHLDLPFCLTCLAFSTRLAFIPLLPIASPAVYHSPSRRYGPGSTAPTHLPPEAGDRVHEAADEASGFIQSNLEARSVEERAPKASLQGLRRPGRRWNHPSKYLINGTGIKENLILHMG